MCSSNKFVAPHSDLSIYSLVAKEKYLRMIVILLVGLLMKIMKPRKSDYTVRVLNGSKIA